MTTPNKPRLLFLSSWYPFPADNGSKIRVYHLLHALSTHYKVVLLAFAFDTADISIVPPFPIEIHPIHHHPFHRSPLLHKLRFLSPIPIGNLPIKEMTYAVDQLSTTQSFDIVVASTSLMATYALRLPPSTRKILEEHNSFTRMMWDRYCRQTHWLPKVQSWVSWQKTKWYEAWLFRQFDAVSMVSIQDQAVSQALPALHTPIALIENGVDCQYNTPASTPPQSHTLVFNGSLTYSANYNAMHYFVTEIFPLIQQKIPTVSLTITGSTTNVDTSWFIQLPNVHLTGFVPDIRPLVSQATACVVPLREGGGTRLKILEAMALGTPVIATSKGAEGLQATPNQHLLIADTPLQFAQQVICVLQDAHCRQQLSTQARQLVVKHYDWHNTAQHFISLINNIH